jgi:ABC-type phosphate transport system substrate-binding protein
MRTILLRLPLILLGGVLLNAAPVVAQTPGFRLVVHPENGVDAFTSREISDLFLKRSTRWPDGITVLPVDQPVGSPVREAFSETVFGRSPSAMAAHWQQQIFSGRGVPPPQLETDSAVMEYVASHVGAVGYVSTTAPLGKVRVVGVGQ